MGPIIGGIVGGILAILLVAIICYLVWKHFDGKDQVWHNPAYTTV